MIGQRCDLWIADVRWGRPEHEVLLDERERDRLSRLRGPLERSRFLVAAALTRVAVAQECGTAATAIRLDRTCPRCAAPHGKPRLVDVDLHVSISHSDRTVAVALTGAGPVGVDIERIVPARAGQLSGVVLAEGETMRCAEDFFTYWCRKESVVKATGDGLRVPLAEVRVGAADRPPRLISYPGQRRAARMHDLELGAGYRGAVTVLTDREIGIRALPGRDLLAWPG